MKCSTADEWFLKEKAEVVKILSADCGDVCVNTFMAKAMERIKNDPRSALERGASRDDFGRALLDAMRDVKSTGQIKIHLNKTFGVDFSIQHYADVAKNMFPHEYDTYLRRYYLSYFADEIVHSLLVYYLEPINVKFLRFLSDYESSCISLDVVLEDFVFCANHFNFILRMSPVEKAAELVKKGAMQC